MCHQTGDEIKASRLALRAWSSAGKGGELPAEACSPWRDRPKAENRKLFERMKQGRYAEGEACLRMRGDLRSDNSALWDPAAYRVLFHAHPRTGSEWCIYPTYDYTHCIVDSLEQVRVGVRVRVRVRVRVLGATSTSPCPSSATRLGLGLG